MEEEVFVVHKINPKSFHVEIISIDNSLESAKQELNEACSPYFDQEKTYNVIKESDTRINIYSRTNGWITSVKELVCILDITSHLID